MENPWLQLPIDAPYVLRQDLPIVEAFNARYGRDSDIAIQSQLLPEPFIGDPGARVYLLNLNPGYSPEDDDWHGRPVYRAAIIANLRRESAKFPFYFLDPALEDAPGSAWWRSRLRWWTAEFRGETLARNLFCAELFPYHSRVYKPALKTVSSDGLVPSSGYTVHLVREAIRTNRPVGVMRAFRAWCGLIPELAGYGNLFRTNSPRNVSLSRRNLDGYARLVDELGAAP